MQPTTTELIEPEYYKNFHCLAADCRDDCCHGWMINVPRHCYMKLRSAPKSPELDTLVREAVVRNRRAHSDNLFASMKLNERGDCLFLNEERLCGLQIECGAGVLPDICREFPRRVMLRGHLIERCCTPACEEVVRLLWDLPDGLRFGSEPLKGRQHGVPIPTPEGCEILYEHFLEIQMLTVRILQNRAYPLDGRVLLLGLALEKLRESERTQDPPAIEAWLRKYAAFAAGDSYRATLDKLPANPRLFLSNNVETVRALPYLSNPDHIGVLQKLLNNLQVRGEGEVFVFDLRRYDELRRMFSALLGEGDRLLENVIVNEWFHQGSPLDGKRGVWEGYVRFCVLYSLFKFMLIGNMTPETGRDGVVQTVVDWSRMLLHSQRRVDALVRQFIESGSDTLAHMAVLVNG